MKMRIVLFVLISLNFINSDIISNNRFTFEVNNLRCEYEQNPLGIDILYPRLSWQLQASQRNFNQSSYQILVASSKENLESNNANMWNSGKVESTQSIQVVYKGKVLVSKTKYYWKVKVWDNNNDSSEYSEIASFETAMLKESDWEAKWISSPIVTDWFARDNEIRKRGNNASPFNEYPAPLYRKSFESLKQVASARAYITGVGFYELHINGEKVGDNILDPAFTDYDDHVLYTTLDVTQFIQNGKNVIGVMLGNGWYNMQTRAAWGFNLAPWRAAPTLKCQIEITYTDQSKEVIVSDETWKFTLGPIIFNSIRQGETYDANKEIEGWDIANFDDSNWNNVDLVRGPAGKLTSQVLPPIKVRKELPPKSIVKLDEKKYLIDFGQNMAGFVQLKVSGEKGDSIVIKYGERLNPDNSLDQKEIAKHTYEERFQMDIFILNGQGIETFQPRFVYHGFQYIEISGLNKKPTSDQIIAKAISTSFTQAGSFKTSNNLLNKIQQNTWWSYVNNFVGYPLDCPQREKNGWTGDAQLACETGLFNFHSQTSYLKWVKDLIDAQKSDGSLPGIVPTNGWGFQWGNGPAWDHAIMNVPWNLYLYSGDIKILEDTYPYMKKYVNFLETKAEDYIVDWGLGDWAPAKTKTPRDVTSTAYYYKDAKILAKTAELLGNTGDAILYSRLAYDIRNAFNKKYYNAEKGIYSNGSQTALSCALYFGLVISTEETKVLNNLEKAITKSDMNLDFGILGAKFVLNSFTMYDRPEAAYNIVNTEKYPGWGNWIKQGATTLWENWNGETNSLNHIMFGDVSAWMYKTLAGIRPDPQNPGFKHFFIAPYFPNDLEWISTSYESMYGKIKVDWSKNKEGIIMNITIPANTSATISFPTKELKNVKENGNEIGLSDFLGLEKSANAIQLKVGSGKYKFEIDN